MDRDTFDEYVDFACEILETIRQDFGETIADGMVHLYVHRPEERREGLLRDLISGSGEFKGA